MNRLLSVLFTTMIITVSSFSQAQIIDLGIVNVRAELVSRSGNFEGNPLVLEYVTINGIEVPSGTRLCYVSDSLVGEFSEGSFHLAINTSTNQVIADGSEIITPDVFVYNSSNPALPVFTFEESNSEPETIPENESISGERTEYSKTIYDNSKLGEQLRGTDVFTVSENYINSSGQMLSTFCKETWTITGYLSTTPPPPEQEETITYKILQSIHETFRGADIKASKSTGALKVKSRPNSDGVRN